MQDFQLKKTEYMFSKKNFSFDISKLLFWHLLIT